MSHYQKHAESHLVERLKAQIAKLEAALAEAQTEARIDHDNMESLEYSLAAAEKDAERFKAALRQIHQGAKTQGAHTGMSWAQVAQICDAALRDALGD